MKSKASLSLMEQLIMVLVFAVAASVCLRGFVYAQQTSETIEQQGQAVVCAQNAAETLKACYGNLEEAANTLSGTQEEDRLTICYNEQWEAVQDDGDWAYCLEITNLPTEEPGLGQAGIRVIRADEKELYTLTVGWQEVG